MVLDSPVRNSQVKVESLLKKNFKYFIKMITKVLQFNYLVQFHFLLAKQDKDDILVDVIRSIY